MSSLSKPKLMLLEKLTTEHIFDYTQTWPEGLPESKTRRNRYWTDITGYYILRQRGVDVNMLPREIVIKDRC